jgi:hypothetical protein
MTKDKINSRGLPYQSYAMNAFRISCISGMDSDETQNKGLSAGAIILFFINR